MSIKSKMLRYLMVLSGNQDVPGRTEKGDGFTTYDPLLTNVNPRMRYPHYRGGFKIWPSLEAADVARWRIMCHGNSTSLWPSHPWSLSLGKRLQAAGHSVAIFNGAGKGHSSSQELLRVIRDAPGIRPHIVVALSGICDLGNITNAKNYPFMHKYARKAAQHLRDSGYVLETNFGYPDASDPAEVWCRNQRIAKVVADEMGIDYLTILQPVQGFGRYQQSPEELVQFQSKARVVLRGSNLPYGEAIVQFYTRVQQIIRAHPEKYAHVVDFTDVFAEVTGVYRDHRHQNEKGVEHLAARIGNIVLDRLQRRSMSDSSRMPGQPWLSASVGES